MRGGLALMITAASLIASAAIAADLPAFPGAEGCGAATTGGRGGAVLKVTTLADSGPGSLRAAIAAKGPRVIVFDVAGIIDLQSPLTIRNGDVTLAGQSSPGGVTLRRYGLVVDADNVIVRFLRARPGPDAGEEVDAVSVAGGAGILLDHVSASWSVDEAFSVSQTRSAAHPFLDKVTVQWSIIAEGLDKSVHGKGAHGYGSLVRGHNGACYSFHHNLWAHHRARMPRPGNFVATKDDPLGPQFQFWNNVFYNWGGSHAGYNADTEAVSRYDFLNNWYLQGPDSKAALAFEEECSACRSHFSGNAMNGAVAEDQMTLLVCAAESCNFENAPTTDYRPVAESAVAAAAAILKRAGASFNRDAVDTRIVAEVAGHGGGIINHPDERGGWPAIEARTPLPDADRDGIPDRWESERGLDPADATDAFRDADGDGYGALEDYLNELAETAGGR